MTYLLNHIVWPLTYLLTALSILLCPIAMLTIGRPFDRLFRHRSIYWDPHIIFFSQMIRSFCYMSCIVLHHYYKEDSYFAVLYHYYSFRECANRWQVIFSFSYFSILMAVLFLGTVIGIINIIILIS